MRREARFPARRPPPSPARSLRRDDRANGGLLALEAVVVALFLFTSVAFVASHQLAPPSQPTNIAREALAAQLQDVVSLMGSMPDPDYGNKMQRYIVEMLNGETAGVKGFLKRAVNPQAKYRVTLHTTTGDLMLWEEEPPTREVMSRAALFAPAMDTAMMVPELGSYDGNKMGMGVYAIPLRNGFPVNDRNIPIEVEVQTDGGALRSTQMVQIGSYSEVTMGLLDGSEVKNYWTDSDSSFVLRLNVSNSVTLPIGTRLAIQLPYYWINVEANGGASWTAQSSERTPSGWVIRATTASSVAAGFLDFDFRGERPPTDHPNATSFDLGYSTLDDSTRGFAHLVFRGNNDTATLAAPFARTLSMSFPKRLATNSLSNWSIVVPHPSRDPSVELFDECKTNCLNVSRITIRQPQEKSVFDSVTGPGWSKVDTSKIEWTGMRKLASDTASEFRFEVRVGNAGGGNAFLPAQRIHYLGTMYGPNATLQLDNATAYFRAYPNVRFPGYNTQNGQQLLCSDIRIDERLHGGCAAYQINHLAAIHRLSNEVAMGMYAATFHPSAAEANPNLNISLTVDFTRLVGMLQGPDFLGAGDTRITVYYPWSGKNSTLATWPEFFTETNPAHAFTTNVTFRNGLPYGTYIAVAEKDLNFAGGSTTDQVVRKVTWFNYGNGVSDATETFYQVSVAAWLDDWS